MHGKQSTTKIPSINCTLWIDIETNIPSFEEKTACETIKPNEMMKIIKELLAAVIIIAIRVMYNYLSSLLQSIRHFIEIPKKLSRKLWFLTKL